MNKKSILIKCMWIKNDIDKTYINKIYVNKKWYK